MTESSINKTLKLHEATQGEITISPQLISMIQPVPYDSALACYGAKTFIAYKKNRNDVVHYYVEEEIAEMMH